MSEPPDMNDISAQVKVGSVLTLLEEYGSTDGGHHKQWLLDQILRVLCGNDEIYKAWVHNYEYPDDACQETDEPDYEWDIGIPP